MKKGYIAVLVMLTTFMYYSVLRDLDFNQSQGYIIESLSGPLIVLGVILGSYYLVKRFRKSKPSKPISF